VSFGFALVGAVVGEFLGARQGIGLLIATAQGAFNANGVFAAMFILAVVALAAESLITLVENRLLKWRPNQTPRRASDPAGDVGWGGHVGAEHQGLLRETVPPGPRLV